MTTPKPLEPWQQRVLQEWVELRGRIRRLKMMIESPPVFASIDAEDQRLMKNQLMAMDLYEAALSARIDRFG